MIEKIIEFSIRNRFIVIVAWLAIAVWGVYAVINTPVDAIPDLSENQVIVFTDWMGRSPREIEDQITYPLSVNLQGLAGVKTVRSSSEFNFSMINIIFDDNVDFYFARQRVLERLALAGTFLPADVVPYLAPDATALGQIFWYTVEGEGYDLGRLRAIQDWYVRYQLNSVPGVAQVASVGGYPIEYQIDVDPNKLRAYGVTLGEVYSAVARSNSAVGGRVIHKGNAEYLIRSIGWIASIKDIKDTVIKADAEKGTPVTVGNLASVSLGTQFRRSVLEKDGSEAVGAAVMMRHGENPLAVTQRIKDKIQQLQPGLPEGVRIVPFYDRTRLIEGAIHTLTDILTHEMLIASVAVLVILIHVRSAVVICLTLPLAVLVSFILMRYVGVTSNIMSLAGIAISIGVLVDQAIVMVENATHRLTGHFGKQKVTGDIRELIIPACRTVGRPIFFSVLIILLSFAPVFALTGRDAKTFHPLAFTKSFAMIGVALISITLVPALIPTFIRGRLRSEQENPIVRSLINIYKPMLTWALPRRNLVLWMFAVLLILGAGIFPLDAIVGISWHVAFLAVVGCVTALTVMFIDGTRWQVLAFASLAALSLAAHNFPKIGREAMPSLDEGTIMDMPITAPRASVAEVADDIKVRDAALRRFPEVEQVVGKAGRAETPTDPSPLDMIETVVNLRPQELWPKRKIRYADARRQARVVMDALSARELVGFPSDAAAADTIVDTATMTAINRMDATLRAATVARYREFERQLGPRLAHDLVGELVERWRKASRLLRPVEATEIDLVAKQLARQFGARLAVGVAQEEVNRMLQATAETLTALGAVELNDELLSLPANPLESAAIEIGSVLGAKRPTLVSRMHRWAGEHRESLWKEEVARLDYEIFDQAVGAYNWYAIEGLIKQTRAYDQGRLEQFHKSLIRWLGPLGVGAEQLHDIVSPYLAALGFHDSARLMAGPEPSPVELKKLRADLDGPLDRWLFLWKTTKAELVKEMDTTIQMPGWGNIWTQPIINRINMLATGVRTMVGIKVFGDNQAQISQTLEEVAAAVRPVRGAVDVSVEQTRGKGYLEITIDRQRAARYGINVGDVQDVVEVALGGKGITTTVEGRERHPVRIRYARSRREDEEDIKNLLISPGGTSMAASGSEMAAAGGTGGATARATGARPLQIPLSMVADVKIVEGPAMIKSENGMLTSSVQLNVRDRDLVGCVEELQRVVAAHVKLPQGAYIEWSGEFEHVLKSRKTLQVVFPAVLLLIFIILYLTYNDFMDAVLMMMAVPEALAGGVFFLWLFGYNFSVAVQVGFIACFGMATETGIIMLVYLREAIERRGGLEKIASLEELKEAVIDGAVHRLRPKLLTEGVAIVALAPMLWASGVGHEVISAMAAPVLGGLLISDEVVDLFIPVRFYWVRRQRWLKMHAGETMNDKR